MAWVPDKPPTHRVKLLVFAIAAIPFVLLVVATLVLLWQLLGQASATAQ